MEVTMITKEDLRIIANKTLNEFVKESGDIGYEIATQQEDMESVTIIGKKKNANTVWHSMEISLFHERGEFTSSYEVNNGFYKIHREMLIKQQADNIKQIKKMRKQLEDLQDIADDMGLTFEEILKK